MWFASWERETILYQFAIGCDPIETHVISPRSPGQYTKKITHKDCSM